MRRRKLIWIICIAVIFVSIAAGASKLSDIAEDKMNETSTGLVMSDECAAENSERLNLISESLAEIEDIEHMSKFDIMLKALDATIENPVDYNNIIYNFEYLRKVYKLTDEQLDYMADLIIQGYEPYDVLDICYFWLDTNENIEIIEKIYTLKDRYKGGTWIENAFNRVTDNKCGVLDEDGVNEYLGKGLTTDDIYMANRLCRRGVYTIQEILDMRLDGRTFVDITADVNGIPTDNIPAEVLQPVQAAVMSATEGDIGEQEREKDRDIIDTQEIEQANILTKLEGGQFGEYIKRAVAGEELSAVAEQAKEAIDSEIDADLREREIYKNVTKEDREAYADRFEEESE